MLDGQLPLQLCQTSSCAPSIGLKAYELCNASGLKGYLQRLKALKGPGVVPSAFEAHVLSQLRFLQCNFVSDSASSLTLLLCYRDYRFPLQAVVARTKPGRINSITHQIDVPNNEALTPAARLIILKERHKDGVFENTCTRKRTVIMLGDCSDIWPFRVSYCRSATTFDAVPNECMTVRANQQIFRDRAMGVTKVYQDHYCYFATKLIRDSKPARM